MHEPLIAAAKAQALREAADAWGDGREGFPYPWLLERAAEIEDAEQRRPYTEQETTK